jgi:hypothetical protein
MSLINKMNVGNTDYDIQDRLMPDAIGQAGQVLRVKDNGSGLEFSTIESGVKLYQHRISFTADFGSSSDTDTGDFSFLIVSSYDREYTAEEFATIFNTYGSSFIALSTIRVPETGAMPYSGLGMVVFSEAADVLEVRAYYSVNDSVKEYHKTGSGGNVIRLTDTVTEL